jgi:hypothetical protein
MFLNNIQHIFKDLNDPRAKKIKEHMFVVTIFGRYTESSCQVIDYVNEHIQI